MMYSPLLFTTSAHLSTNWMKPFRKKSADLVSKNLLSQFLRSSSLSKVTPLIWFDMERKGNNPLVQSLESTGSVEELPIQALGVRI